MLIRSAGAQQSTEGALRLHTFVVRHGIPTYTFQEALESFLVSINPLTNLQILLHGTKHIWTRAHELFEVHGRDLSSLVWETKNESMDRDG